MRTENEVNKATSIQELEDSNYKSIPIIIIDDKVGDNSVGLYIPALINGEDIEYTLKIDKEKYQQCNVGTVESKIEEGIKDGTIYEDNSTFTDYEVLDEKYFEDIKKRYLYAISKNSLPYRGVGGAANTSYFTLYNAGDIQVAIEDMKSKGGKRNYTLSSGETKYGYLLSVEYDYTKKEYRGVMNNGTDGVAFTQFSKSARTPNTVYVVDEVVFTGKFYRLIFTDKLDFSARY